MTLANGRSTTMLAYSSSARSALSRNSTEIARIEQTRVLYAVILCRNSLGKIACAPNTRGITAGAATADTANGHHQQQSVNELHGAFGDLDKICLEPPGVLSPRISKASLFSPARKVPIIALAFRHTPTRPSTPCTSGTNCATQKQPDHAAMRGSHSASSTAAPSSWCVACRATAQHPTDILPLVSASSEDSAGSLAALQARSCYKPPLTRGGQQSQRTGGPHPAPPPAADHQRLATIRAGRNMVGLGCAGVQAVAIRGD